MTWTGSTWTHIGLVLGGLVVGLAAFYAVLPRIVRPMLRAALWFRYDLKAVGLENLPKSGPVLLVSNHLSWFDGFFMAAILPREGTALVNAALFNLPILGPLARRCGLLPIPSTGPKGQRAAIETARRALDDGRLLAIFPEGQISRTGMTGPFHRGLEVILSNRESVPVVPAAIDNAWGSVASYSDGRFFTKWPKGYRRTIAIAFGPPIGPPVTAFRARQAVAIQGVAARSILPEPPELPGPIDFSLPFFDHPSLGPLTGSTADVNYKDVRQVGQKPGSVGQALPGLAIRVVDDSGTDLGPDVEGRLQALLPARAGWVDLDRRGRLDRDGFVTLA